MLVTAHIGHWAITMLELAPVITVVAVGIVWKVRNRAPVTGGS